MYGVSKINSEQNIMLTTFPGAQYSAQSLAEHLDVFAKAGIVVDMICQSAPRGAAVDFSFTTSYDNFAAVMKALPAAAKANPPLVSGGYSKSTSSVRKWSQAAAWPPAPWLPCPVPMSRSCSSRPATWTFPCSSANRTRTPPSTHCTRRLQSDGNPKTGAAPFKGLHLFFIYSCGSTLLPEMAGIQPHT